MTVVARMPRLLTGRSHATQPALGLLGLLLVVPIAGLLALGAGAEGSTLVLGPLVTYSLPLVVMVAFWCADWPGSRLRAGLSGWVDTALIAAGAVVLAGIGQTLAGRLDVVGLFDPTPGPGHVPTFPATLPLAGTAFVMVLQLTLVGEGWPLRNLPRLPAGLLAVAISWTIALGVYYTLVGIDPPDGSDVLARHGPVPGAQLGAALVVISAWQVLCYVVWRGWPFTAIAGRGLRTTCAHVTVLGGGIGSYLVAHVVLSIDAIRIAAVAGCFIAAGLVFGMLLEDWLHDRLAAPAERAALLACTLAVTALLAVVLGTAAGALHFTRVGADDWVEHAALNALSTSIILHVAIGGRWPFGATQRAADPR